jgi:hypothetical protein
MQGESGIQGAEAKNFSPLPKSLKTAFLKIFYKLRNGYQHVFLLWIENFYLNTNNLITARLRANHILIWNPKMGVLWVLAIHILMLVILLW